MKYALPYIIGILGLFPATLSAQGILAVDFSGQVWELDATTGSGNLLGPSGFTGFNALTRNSNGEFFTAADFLPTQQDIYTIDPLTAQATLFTSLNINRPINALAFDDQDNLFAIIDGTNGRVDELYAIDFPTNSATRVGFTGFENIEGMDWGGGTLWAWACQPGPGAGDGLLTIDPQTGIATYVGGFGICEEATGISFADPGNATGLAGAGDSLYQISTASGQTTLVGGGSYADLRGIEFLDQGCTSFALSDPFPGTAGVQNSVTFGCATPNASVVIVFGFSGGLTGVPPCPGLNVDISNPTIGGIVSANTNGEGSVSGFAPPGLSGNTLLLQAIDLGGCQTSNLVSYTFP